MSKISFDFDTNGEDEYLLILLVTVLWINPSEL
jgi:hypothetical protein